MKSLHQTIYSLIDAPDAPARLKIKEDPYRYFIEIDRLTGYATAENCINGLIKQIVDVKWCPLEGFEECCKFLQELKSHPDTYDWVIDWDGYGLEFETIYDALVYIATHIRD